MVALNFLKLTLNYSFKNEFQVKIFWVVKYILSLKTDYGIYQPHFLYK